MRYTVRKAQDVSKMCAVCGRENPLSLNARFYELENDELLGVFAPREEHQGYPGRMHGGIATAAVDETIGRAINIIQPGTWGVTVSLTVRFRKPVPLDREMHTIARISSDSSRMFEGTGEIVLDDGTVAVEASGTYMKLPIERIAQGDVSDQIFADADPTPAEVDLPG
jgi:acyl-coenzyme A thioesterase PaaI-like protein